MRFCFTTWFGAGNQVPTIGLAQELVARGHEVCVAGYASQRSRFERLGFEFAVLERADDAYIADTPPEQVMAELVRGVWASHEQLVDVLDLLDRQRFDAVVVDCMMFGALAALEKAQVPGAVLVHSAPGALLPPGGPGEPLILGPVNELRATFGRGPVENLWSAWARFPTLCASIPDLDPLATEVPRSFGYVGPLFERSPSSGRPLPWPPDDPRPLVMASFSTGYAWDQRSRIDRTLDALDDAGRYRVLTLTAMTDMTGITPPDGAEVRISVPHAEVLPSVAVTVTHAGHGTLAASLAHGVPVVALPNPAADQPALAARVAELGAGIALDGETATAAQIQDAVATVLASGTYQSAARKLGDAIRAAPGVSSAADAVERVSRSAWPSRVEVYALRPGETDLDADAGQDGAHG